jgi:hypothetical protein
VGARGPAAAAARVTQMFLEALVGHRARV